jgi:hypothetical protein
MAHPVWLTTQVLKKFLQLSGTERKNLIRRQLFATFHVKKVQEANLPGRSDEKGDS